MDQEAELQKAFQRGLGLNSSIDYASLEFSKTAQWDSIAHMRLVAAVEESFNIRLSIDDILGMSSYPVASKIVAKHLKT